MIKKTTFVISVSASAECYRHIKIAGTATLEDLSSAILDAFNFENDHAHAFFLNNSPWSDFGSYYMAMVDEKNNKRHTCDYTLCKARLEAGKRFLYIFDFGDEWQFQCRVLRELDEPVDVPQVISVKGEPPLQYSK